MGGGVGQGPREEEKHGWGVLGFGGAEGGNGSFEIVLLAVRWHFNLRVTPPVGVD